MYISGNLSLNIFTYTTWRRAYLKGGLFILWYGVNEVVLLFQPPFVLESGNIFKTFGPLYSGWLVCFSAESLGAALLSPTHLTQHDSVKGWDCGFFLLIKYSHILQVPVAGPDLSVRHALRVPLTWNAEINLENLQGIFSPWDFSHVSSLVVGCLCLGEKCTKQETEMGWERNRTVLYVTLWKQAL